MPLLKAIVPEDTKARFKALAKSQDKTEADLLREMINIVVGEQVEHVKLKKPDDLEPNSGKVWASVRIPSDLLEKAKSYAENKGMAKSRWISALINTHLGGLPIMTDEEVLALQQSNRELAAIGRNINQIARSLNEAFYETERVKLTTLDELKKIIMGNRVIVNNLIKASRKSWGIRNELD